MAWVRMPRLRHTIFISYSADAIAFAIAIKACLDSAGYVALLDRHILEPGGSYDTDLESQVKSCSLFLFVISARSVLSSGYSIAELGWAVASRRKILGVFAPGHESVEPPTEVQARTMVRIDGERIAATISAVRAILGHPLRPALILAGEVAAFVALVTTVLYPRSRGDDKAEALIDEMNTEVARYVAAIAAIVGAHEQHFGDSQFDELAQKYNGVSMNWDVAEVHIKAGLHTYFPAYEQRWKQLSDVGLKDLDHQLDVVSEENTDSTTDEHREAISKCRRLMDSLREELLTLTNDMRASMRRSVASNLIRWLRRIASSAALRSSFDGTRAIPAQPL